MDAPPTKIGLYTAAIGGGPDAARRSGIAIDRYVIGQFVATGIVVAVAAALTVGQLGSASPYVGTELELDAIIAVVIGGTSLAGGYGSVSRTAVGVTFMSVLNSGLLNLGLTDSYYQTARGLALLGVLTLQIVTRRLVGPRPCAATRRRSKGRSANESWTVSTARSPSSPARPRASAGRSV